MLFEKCCQVNFLLDVAAAERGVRSVTTGKEEEAQANCEAIEQKDNGHFQCLPLSQIIELELANGYCYVVLYWRPKIHIENPHNNVHIWVQSEVK